MTDVEDEFVPQSLWQCLWYPQGRCFYGSQERAEYLSDYLSDNYPNNNFLWGVLYRVWNVEQFFRVLKTIKMGRPPLKSFDTEEEWGYWEYAYVFGIRNPILDMAYSISDFIKYKVLRIRYVDPHIACYSYPNCDEAPMGCRVMHGEDAEPYGHRD